LESITKFAPHLQPPPPPPTGFTQLFFHFLVYIHLSLILNGSMEKVAMLILGVTEPHPIENIAFT